MTSLPLVFDAPKRGLPPRHLVALSPAQRAEAVAALGEKPFRAKQLSNHYFSRLTVDPAEMTDIPATTRDKLVADLMPPLFTVVRKVTADEGTTAKTLLRAHDGTLIESVLMRYPDRATLCISSQAGCARPARQARRRPDAAAVHGRAQGPHRRGHHGEDAAARARRHAHQRLRRG